MFFDLQLLTSISESIVGFFILSLLLILKENLFLDDADIGKFKFFDFKLNNLNNVFGKSNFHFEFRHQRKNFFCFFVIFKLSEKDIYFI